MTGRDENNNKHYFVISASAIKNLWFYVNFNYIKFRRNSSLCDGPKKNINIRFTYLRTYLDTPALG